MVVDMGTHVLRHVPGLHSMVQLLAPGLEERARALPPLLSAPSTPGAALLGLPLEELVGAGGQLCTCLPM